MVERNDLTCLFWSQAVRSDAYWLCLMFVVALGGHAPDFVSSEALADVIAVQIRFKPNGIGIFVCPLLTLDCSACACLS
jgi:hypothetical protein